jgi:ABC-type glycerol-3-phosphate transport system substrate-binding protein
VRDVHEVDFLEPLVAANRCENRTFGVSAFASLAGLWYRRRELEAAGLEPPRTWSELRSVARALRREGMPHPIVMPGGSKGGETTAYCLIAFLASNGASVLEQAYVSLDSRATAQALRFLRSLIEEELMAADVVGYVAGAMSYAIFRQAAQPELAMRVLEAAVAPEALARLARITGRVPARRSAVALASPTLPFLTQTAELLESAAIRPQTPLYPRVSAQLQAMLDAVLTGRLGPAAAARRAAEMIGAITGLPVAHDGSLPGG